MVFWFKVYAAASALLYAAGAAVVVVMLLSGDEDLDAPPIVLWVAVGCDACLVAVMAASVLLRPREWFWVLGFILICMGMVWLCCLPVTIPLLVHWLKPETRAWFGKT